MAMGKLLAAFEMDAVNNRITLKMDGFDDLPLSHRGLALAHSKVDRILGIFVAKLRQPDTSALTALADAVRFLDKEMGGIALQLVDDYSSVLDKITVRFNHAWPQWREATDIVPLVEVQGHDEDFPFELLPLFDAKEVKDFANYAEAEIALRRFLGFGAAVRRTMGERVETESLVASPQLPVQLLCYGMDGTEAGGRYFGRSLGRIDVDGPWPGPDLSPEDVIEGLIDALFDPERRLASEPGHGRPIQVQHFACHCRTDNQTDSGYALILGGPGQERTITLGDIGTGFRQRNQRLSPIDGPRSLIIANACGSAKIDKESRRSFHRWFLHNHHRGFVGTEIDVPVDLAADFGMQLYQELLSSKPLGEAVVRARRWLLTERHSPLGLLYVLYGDPGLTIQASPSRSSS